MSTLYRIATLLTLAVACGGVSHPDSVEPAPTDVMPAPEPEQLCSSPSPGYLAWIDKDSGYLQVSWHSPPDGTIAGRYGHHLIGTYDVELPAVVDFLDGQVLVDATLAVCVL